MAVEVVAKGKAKTLYTGSREDRLTMEYRDDTSAFDGRKTAALAGKGRVNNAINAHVMQALEVGGIPTHFVRVLSPVRAEVYRLQMLPLEAVVRNITAGSLCRRLGVESGLQLVPPLFELFFKDDALGDPLVTREHVRAFGWASDAQVDRIRELSLAANEVLEAMFSDIGLLLVDYKLEFGLRDGQMVLGDEFTPDGCRLWDAKTRTSLDKDRFRNDEGDVVESYEVVARRLGIDI